MTFVDGATGGQGIETDTGLTYNPSTGLLSTAAITTTGQVQAEHLKSTDDAEIADDLNIGGDIVHIGDTNNKISFGTDTQDYQTGGSSRLDISDSGVRLGGTGARVTSITDDDALGTSDTILCTQGNVKAYADTKLALAGGTMTGAINFDSQNMTNVDINSGTIDGTDVTVGSGKTLDVSAGTLTLAANQISGDKVEGGTIASITISQLGGAMDCNNENMTNVDIDSGTIDGTDVTVGSGKTLNVSAGTLTTSAAQKKAIVEGVGADTDIGAFELRAQTFESDVATGTAPLTVASTTVVTNLNADKLDGADLVDEDDMASDSATKVPTQQSVKAYVDKKKIHIVNTSFNDDMDTDEIFIPMNQTGESPNITNVNVPMVMPVAGKLLKIHFRANQNQNLSSNEITFKLYDVDTGENWNTANSDVLGTKVITGLAKQHHTTVDFTDLTTTGASGTNAFQAGDIIGVSMQHSADQNSGNTSSYLITFVFELDFGGY